MSQVNHTASRPAPWNKGKLVGQKAPLKLKHIWAIRVRLELADRARELALFNLAIDSKLRSCDLVKLKTVADRPKNALARTGRPQAVVHLRLGGHRR